MIEIWRCCSIEESPNEVSNQGRKQKTESTIVFSELNNDENCRDDNDNTSKVRARFGDKRWLTENAEKTHPHVPTH